MRIGILTLGLIMAIATGCSSGSDKDASSDTNALKSQTQAQGKSELYTRIILIEKAENLRKVKGVDQTKPLQETLLDYLKMNNAALQPPSSASYDDKTKALTVRGTLLELDRVEFLLVKLRDMP